MTIPHLITFRGVATTAAMVGIASEDDSAWIGTRLDDGSQYIALAPNVISAKPLAPFDDRVSLTALEQMLENATIVDNTELERIRTPQPWDVLREAADIMHPKSHPTGLWTPEERALRDEAKRLEREHRAAQERAEQDAAREALIEKAARYAFACMNGSVPPWESIIDYRREHYLIMARTLADAGYLAEAVQP